MHQVAKVQYPGLISVRIDWFDLLAVQGTFTSHLQHHSLKASILQDSVLFMVQLSHPYMNECLWVSRGGSASRSLHPPLGASS